MIVQRGEFANYLRKNSGVKGDATSSEIHGACSAKLERCERPSNAFMAKALPDYLVNQVTAEVRLATRRMFTARSVRRSLASQKGCRVNIGCGKNPIQGWINLDVVSYPGVYFWDCRLGLPFSDSAVAGRRPTSGRAGGWSVLARLQRTMGAAR